MGAEVDTKANNGLGVLIAGVGGQGTLLASRVIGNVAIARGYDVKVSEVHGMSQRGGSVVTYVKFARGRVFSPIIDFGQADVLMAFELLEAYRSIGYLKKGGVALVNTQRINPMPVISGAAEYPGEIPGKMEGIGKGGLRLICVDALAEAKKAGGAKAVNMVLTGVLARVTDEPGQAKSDWLNVISESVPPKFEKMNIAAFEAGYAQAGVYAEADGKKGSHE